MEKWRFYMDRDPGQVRILDSDGKAVGTACGDDHVELVVNARKLASAPELAQACRLAMVELAKTEECEAYTALRAALTAYDGRT